MAAITPYGYQAFHAAINASTEGSNELVAANAGHAIRVVSLALNVDSTNKITFFGGTTALTGAAEVEGGDQIVLPLNEYGWMQTAHGVALNLTLYKNHGIMGMLTYFLV